MTVPPGGAAAAGAGVRAGPAGPVAAHELLDYRGAGRDGTPDEMRHLLARARWDADGVRDDVRSFIVSADLWQEGYLQGRSGRRICALLRAASARAIVQ